MLHCQSVYLRAWQESDIPALMSLRNDVALQAMLLARARGSDENKVRLWLAERCSGDDRAFYIIANRTDDAALGYLQLSGMNPIDRNAEIGICLAPAAQGRGIGTEVMEWLIDYSIRDLGLHKLSLRVQADNERAIRCYLKVGFCKCGLYKQHVFIESSWRDVLLMELILAADR
ncbi:MAG: GNAT family N-acetyltransferase [Planctomycetales bacterium]|nr:GNAT family N-acetyltransferase [Planctomycetales bacterium]